MKQFIQNICIALALTAMVFSCSSHRTFEENVLEIEETELEDLLTRREEASRSSRKRDRSDVPQWGLQSKSQHALKIRRHLDQSQRVTDGERQQFNGLGTFLRL